MTARLRQEEEPAEQLGSPRFGEQGTDVPASCERES
jgi:hypothetical protein